MPTFFAGQTDYIEKLNDVDAATGTAQAAIDAHIADTTAAHAATAISNTPAGNIAATTVQAAINELDTEKLSASATTLPASFVNASLNSITPDGGTLSVAGSISATGKLGISNNGGTADYPIDVIRTDAGSTNLRVRNNSADAAAYAMVGVNAFGNSWGMRMGSAAANANALEWVVDAFSAPVVKMSMTTTGDLGLGVSPATEFATYRQFTVSGTNGATISLQDSGVTFLQAVADSAATYLSSYGGTDIIFGTQGGAFAGSTATERMRIHNSTGALLIGQTSNPSSFKLAVTGPVGFAGSLGTVHTSSEGIQIAFTRAGVNYISAPNGGMEYDGSSHIFKSADQLTTFATVNSTGLSVTGLLDLSNAASGQIKFPATQNASADANTLDDYEEGGWTVTATSAAGSITSYTATGAYTKVGRMVSVQARVIVTDAGTGTGALVVSLPFVPSAQRSAGSLAEVVLTGKSGRVYVPGADSNAYCVYYDNTSVIATGADFSIQVTYSI